MIIDLSEMQGKMRHQVRQNQSYMLLGEHIQHMAGVLSAHLVLIEPLQRPDDDFMKLVQFRQQLCPVKILSLKLSVPVAGIRISAQRKAYISAQVADQVLAEVQRRKQGARLLVVLTGRPEASTSPLAADAETIALPRAAREARLAEWARAPSARAF